MHDAWAPFSVLYRRRYVDFPITDVLQMMGRAGRPQYDQHGVAVIMVADAKKSFYKKASHWGPHFMTHVGQLDPS